MASHIDRILGDGYMADLQRRPMGEIRAMRTECQAVETGLSFQRRLVQGRLDIVGVELQRRRDGGDPTDLSELVGRLPEILADRTRAPGLGRLPQTMAPGELDHDVEEELETITAGHDVQTLATIDDAELASMREGLEELERKVSRLRRELFDRIDALQAEITRRYRTGEANVEALLQ